MPRLCVVRSRTRLLNVFAWETRVWIFNRLDEGRSRFYHVHGIFYRRKTVHENGLFSLFL